MLKTMPSLPPLPNSLVRHSTPWTTVSPDLPLRSLSRSPPSTSLPWPWFQAPSVSMFGTSSLPSSTCSHPGLFQGPSPRPPAQRNPEHCPHTQALMVFYTPNTSVYFFSFCYPLCYPGSLATRRLLCLSAGNPDSTPRPGPSPRAPGLLRVSQGAFPALPTQPKPSLSSPASLLVAGSL